MHVREGSGERMTRSERLSVAGNFRHSPWEWDLACDQRDEEDRGQGLAGWEGSTGQDGMGQGGDWGQRERGQPWASLEQLLVRENSGLLLVTTQEQKLSFKLWPRLLLALLPVPCLPLPPPGVPEAPGDTVTT